MAVEMWGGVLANRIGRISGFLLNKVIVLLSCLSFPVSLRQGLQIPAFPVIYANFYGNLDRFYRSSGHSGLMNGTRLSMNSILFSVLYQMESAFINLALAHIGFVFHLLTVLFKHHYLSEMDGTKEHKARTLLFHNYIGARTGLLFYLIRSVLNGDNNVLFADGQVFLLLKRFKRYLLKNTGETDPEGKVIFENKWFGKWMKAKEPGGEQIILNSASPWNMIAACRYIRKNYCFLLIPESRTDAGRTVHVRFMKNEMKLPEGALWLIRHTGSALSILPMKQFLFLPLKNKVTEVNSSADDTRQDDYGIIIRTQSRGILSRPYRFVPFLHSSLWNPHVTDQGTDEDVLFRMKWKSKKLLFYEGGKVGIIDDNTHRRGVNNVFQRSK